MGFNNYLPEFIKDYLDERKCGKIWDKTYKLKEQEKYAEAAEIYASFALERLKLSNSGYGELSYCLYCKYAFEMWLEAENPQKMLAEGRNVLCVYSNNEGKWLKYSSGKNVEDLVTMVVQMHGAGFAAEADILAKEINGQLEKYELPMRCSVAAAPVRIRGSVFPSVCPQCGAKVPYIENRENVECSYCETVIYAKNIKSEN
jgi:hypothetical protein